MIYFDNFVFSTQSNSRFTSTQTTLRITNVQSADAGFYTCLATNEWGENRGSALLTVTQSTQQVVFTRVPVDQSVTVGGRVTLACSATGTPDPVITWSKASLYLFLKVLVT